MNTSSSVPKYRYFIQSDGRKEYAHKGYHYQATATSLKELWAKIDAQLEHYNQKTSGYAQITTGMKRGLKATTIDAGHLRKIGFTSDGKEIFVHRMHECKPNDPFYYYRWTPKNGGEPLYSMQHVASPNLYSNDRYDIEEITCGEYKRGITN